MFAVNLWTIFIHNPSVIKFIVQSDTGSEVKVHIPLQPFL